MLAAVESTSSQAFLNHLAHMTIDAAVTERDLWYDTTLMVYLLNWGLYGALCVQVYDYLGTFPHDTLTVQALVYGLYLLETAQTISLTHDAFRHFVYGFGDRVSLNKIYDIWLNSYVFDAAIALVFQVYFANRIRNLLTRCKMISAIIVLYYIPNPTAHFVTDDTIFY
ncbi:hypothetical protein MPER_04030 [Moniliophthora perniciosa FA553]|nr:hypothetical protein MPER_04030 [Moniliophthora perniciosa FA553]